MESRDSAFARVSKDGPRASPCVLICRNGKSNPGIELRQINPTGKSLLIFRSRVKPLLQKYFASLPTQISSLIRTVSFRQEGRIARRHETRDGMRWTRRRQASKCEPDEWR
jgi:hypothetical protein